MRQAQFVLAISPWTRMKGLLGTSKKESGGSILVIAPCKSIHTFGMGYNIDVAFVDKHGVVIRTERDVPQCRLLSCRQSCMVLERANAAGKPWFTCGDHIPLRMQLNRTYNEHEFDAPAEAPFSA